MTRQKFNPLRALIGMVFLASAVRAYVYLPAESSSYLAVAILGLMGALILYTAMLRH
jgi:hypothetical protein